MDAGNFFSALQQQRVPLVTPEQLEAQTRKSRDRLTAAIVQLNKELSSLQTQTETLKGTIAREQATVIDLEEQLIEVARQRDKASRNLSRLNVERTELEAESLLEERRIHALKQEIQGLRIDRESLSKVLIDEKSGLLQERIGAQRRMKEALEAEERALVNEIIELRVSVDQGRTLREAKLQQLKSIIEWLRSVFNKC